MAAPSQPQLDVETFKTSYSEALAQMEREIDGISATIERFKAMRGSDPKKISIKKQILAKQRNLEVLATQNARLKIENAERRQEIARCRKFVEEREASIRGIAIIDSALSSNSTKQASLVERRANYKRFRLMYDFKVRCLFQSIYAIFFNVGTLPIKTSLLILRKPEAGGARTVEQINTAVGYIVMLLVAASKISRLNYACMYKFFGSRSTLMAKDKTRTNIIAFLETRMVETFRARPFLDAICLDAVRILELFRVDIGEIHVILQTADLHKFLETLKKCLFRRSFSQGDTNFPSVNLNQSISLQPALTASLSNGPTTSTTTTGQSASLSLTASMSQTA